jgi:hypothetical protein
MNIKNLLTLKQKYKLFPLQLSTNISRQYFCRALRDNCINRLIDSFWLGWNENRGYDPPRLETIVYEDCIDIELDILIGDEPKLLVTLNFWEGDNMDGVRTRQHSGHTFEFEQEYEFPPVVLKQLDGVINSAVIDLAKAVIKQQDDDAYQQRIRDTIAVL